MKRLNIAISGATGRMGTEIARLVSQDPELSEKCLLVTNDNADVWIDFTAPDGTMKLLERIRKPVVIGTTGFSDDQKKRIQDYAKIYPVLKSSNMSLGIESVRQMVQKFPQGGQLSMVEEHHRFKKDMPSGTALMLQETLHQAGRGEVPIHSVRAGGIVGVHEVRWVSDEEEIVITHRAFSRSTFARGAILGSLWLDGRAPGLYKISDVSIWEKT